MLGDHVRAIAGQTVTDEHGREWASQGLLARAEEWVALAVLRSFGLFDRSHCAS